MLLNPCSVLGADQHHPSRWPAARDPQAECGISSLCMKLDLAAEFVSLHGTGKLNP